MKAQTAIVSKSALGLAILVQFGCVRSAQHYLDLGNRDFARGKYADASINHRKAINANPRNAESHYRLALDDLKLGQTAEAYNELTRASQLSPGRDDIAVEKADLALISYSRDPKKPKVLYDQVSQTANRLIAKDSNSFDGLRLSADVRVLDGKLDEALALYRRAEAVRPLDPKVIVPMAQVLFRLNQGADGEKLALDSIRAHAAEAGAIYDVLFNYYVQSGRAADAEKLLRARISSMPKDAVGRLQLAAFYYRMHRDSDTTSVLQGILGDAKAFPQGHILVGDFYQSVGRLDDAVREYNAGLASHSDDKALYQKRIVKILIAQGKRDGALALLDTMLKENSTDVDSQEARAILLRQTGDPSKRETAIAEMNAILQNDPNNAVMRYNLGLAYLDKGDTKSGKGQLSQSAALAPGYIPPRLALADLAQKTGNYSDAIRYTNEVLALDPQNKAAQLGHAAGLLGSKNYRQAGAELSALLKEEPDSIEVNMRMAALEAGEKKYAEAEATYFRLYKPGQKDLRPLEGLIQIYVTQGQSEKALKMVGEALQAAPDSTALHLLRATAAIRAGKLDIAAEDCEWVRSKNPKSVQAYVSLGNIYLAKGDLVRALSNYQTAGELAPNDPKILANIAFVELGSNHGPDAIAKLRKELTLKPEDTVALNNLAYELADSDTDLEQASALAEKAQRMAPNNPGIADTLSWVYVRRGLNDSAIEILSGLVKKYPDQPEFRYHLGVALLQKGQTGEAKNQFNVALSHKPPKDVADKIRQIMSKLG